MRFTAKEIMILDNPYEEIGKGDALAKHAELLNSLSPEAMKKLAEKIIVGCPEDKLSSYGHKIQAIRSVVPANNSTSFYSVLFSAYEVRVRLCALYNSRNPHPHQHLIGSEFNAKLFKENQEFALSLVDGKEPAIASALAYSTPTENQSELSENIKAVFPDSELSKKITSAFKLKNILELLIGETPQQFFSHANYKIDRCNEFAGLIQKIVGDKAPQIGQRLAQFDSTKVRSLILRQLNILSSSLIADEKNIYQIIAKEMRVNMELPTSAVANNPNSLFNEPNQLKQRTGAEVDAETESETESIESDENNNRSVNYCCFGLIPY